LLYIAYSACIVIKFGVCVEKELNKRPCCW